MSLIEIKDLTKSYFSDENVETRVLHGLSFKIEKGEFTAIMGPSGSGKSTLLHVIGFLDEPMGGDYFFEGRSYKDYNNDEIAQLRNSKMGFVFQAFNLLARTTVFDNVRLPLLYSNVPEREWDTRAREAIASVGLSNRETHEPQELSGGEKQRVAIARALVTRPEVIFADEPTGNLDSKSGRVVMDIIQELNEKQGHTIILVTHETETAEHAARIIHLLDGHIEKDEYVRNRRMADDFIK